MLCTNILVLSSLPIQCYLVRYSARVNGEDTMLHATTLQENCSRERRQLQVQYILSNSRRKRKIQVNSSSFILPNLAKLTASDNRIQHRLLQRRKILPKKYDNNAGKYIPQEQCPHEIVSNWHSSRRQVQYPIAKISVVQKQ